MVSNLVQATIRCQKVVIFSKTYCPYCSNAKKLFEKIGQQYTVLELDTMANGSDIQAELAKLTGQNTVPNIFINGKHIGGFDKADELNRSGQLQQLLA